MICKNFSLFCSVLVLLALQLCTATCRAESQDETMERIKTLELQIQQLKELRELQKVSVEKEQHCMKVLGSAKFCKCISETIPRSVNFEQYVHYLIAGKEGLNYAAMGAESRQTVDATLAARDNCIDRGWFK